jgi:hypothetical protein
MKFRVLMSAIFQMNISEWLQGNLNFLCGYFYQFGTAAVQPFTLAYLGASTKFCPFPCDPLSNIVTSWARGQPGAGAPTVALQHEVANCGQTSSIQRTYSNTLGFT